MFLIIFRFFLCHILRKKKKNQKKKKNNNQQRKKFGWRTSKQIKQRNNKEKQTKNSPIHLSLPPFPSLSFSLLETKTLLSQTPFFSAMDVLRRANIFVDGFPFHFKAKLLASKREPLLLLTHFHGDSTGAFSTRSGFQVFAPAEGSAVASFRPLRPKIDEGGGRVPFFKCLHAGHPVQFAKPDDSEWSPSTPDLVPFRTEHCRNSLGFWFPQLRTMYLGDSRVDTDQLTRCQQAVQSTGHGNSDVQYIVGDGVYSTIDVSFPSLSDAKQRLLELLDALESFMVEPGSVTPTVVLHVVCYHSGVLHFVEDALETLGQKKRGNIEVRVKRSDGTQLLPWKPGLLVAAQKFARTFNGAPRDTERLSRRLQLLLEPPSLGRTLAHWERWYAQSYPSPEASPSTILERSSSFSWRPVDVPLTKRNRELRSVLERRKGHLFLSLSSLFFAVSSDPAVAGAMQCCHTGMGHWRICTSFHASKEENQRLLATFPQARFEACPSRPLFH